MPWVACDRPKSLSRLSFLSALNAVLDLRRLALFASAPLGVKCPSDISSGDIEALRDSGVAVLLLGPGVSSEDVALVRERIG